MNHVKIKQVITIEINGKTFTNPKTASKELALVLIRKYHPRLIPNQYIGNDVNESFADEYREYRAITDRQHKRTIARVLPILTHILCI